MNRNVLGALNFADHLMAGNPRKFKRGYTRENAEIATVELLKLNTEETESFLRIMGQKHGVAK
jgi:hypothetical protein